MWPGVPIRHVLPGVHVLKLPGRHVQKKQIFLVATDDRVAAKVLPQLQKLREQPCGEDTGVSADAAVSQGCQLLRLRLPQADESCHTLPPQQRLVGDQEHHSVAVPQTGEP